MVCEVFMLEEKLINKLLILCEENQKKPRFNPYISYPGVKKPVNIVNIANLPLYFHSRHDYFITKGLNFEVRC